MIVRIRRHSHVATGCARCTSPAMAPVVLFRRLIARARAPGGLHPWQGGSPDAQRLAAWLNEPLALLPPARPARTAWHCAVFADPDDLALTDPQWAQVATEIVHATGLARHGDGRGVRWVAARHGTDHIHILATLARQDGTVPPSGRDLPAARKACHAAEDYLGLRSTRRLGKAALRPAGRGPLPGSAGPALPGPGALMIATIQRHWQAGHCCASSTSPGDTTRMACPTWSAVRRSQPAWNPSAAAPAAGT